MISADFEINFNKNRFTMKTIKTLKLSSLFLFILIATQSCMVSSLHPLYTDKDRIYKEELNGTWIDIDSTNYKISTHLESNISKEIKKLEKQKLKLKSNTNLDTALLRRKTILNRCLLHEMKKQAQDPHNRYYQINIIEKQDNIVFNGRLNKLNKSYFLDVIPDEICLEKRLNSSDINTLVAPMHGFFKIQFIDEKLKLNWINSEAFKKLVKDKKIRLSTLKQSDREIITAKTSDIQKFLIKFADTELFNNKDTELILTPLK